MNNLHNPIAVRVQRVQELWLKQSTAYPQARVFVLRYESSDAPLVEGFLALEPTEHGLSDDTFLLFRVSLNSTAQLLKAIISEWINTFQREQQEHPEWNWTEFSSFAEEFKLCSMQDRSSLWSFYQRMLTSFKRFEGIEGNRLVQVLLLDRVESIDILKESLRAFADNLPSFASILLMEDKSKESLYEPIIKGLGKKACLFSLPNQRMNEAYKELAAQGESSDPEVQYRMLLFELGEAAQKQDKGRLKRLAEQRFVPLCRSMNDTAMWVSSYLIVAGFMMQIKGEEKYTQELLDKGLEILQVESPADDPFKFSDLLIQYHMYKGACYAMNKYLGDATSSFMHAVAVAKEVGHKAFAVNAYNSALVVTLKRERRDYFPILKEAYSYVIAFSDEELKSINISFIVSAYLDKEQGLNSKQRDTLRSRMVELYGVHWDASPKEAMKHFQESQHTPL